VRGSFDDALSLVRQLADRAPVALVNSVNPYRLEGQKTGAFEICDVLGRAPDWLCLPVGNAGNITAYWKGFSEYHAAGLSPNTPRLLGVQAAGAAPLVLGHAVDRPETVATAIRIGRPARGEEAILAAEALQRPHRGGQLEGHPGHAAPAGAGGRVVRAGLQPPAPPACWPSAGRPPSNVRGQTVVAVITGHGLKDTDASPAAWASAHVIGRARRGAVGLKHSERKQEIAVAHAPFAHWTLAKATARWPNQK
jgi:threonine synthase